jgi:quercetin dioxygenase-like cupin family protein
VWYKGNLREDGLFGVKRGWVIGKFLATPCRNTTTVEVKYWEFLSGQNHGHPAEVSDTLELTYVLEGIVRCEIEGESHVLCAGDYIVVHPGTPKNTVADIIKTARGITIKAPSDPPAKHVV